MKRQTIAGLILRASLVAALAAGPVSPVMADPVFQAQLLRRGTAPPVLGLAKLAAILIWSRPLC